MSSSAKAAAAAAMKPFTAACVGEGDHELGVPRADALDEPAAVGDELAAVDAHVAVELDAPQLVVQPLRQVLDAAGVHARAARAVAAGRPQPLARRGPGHAGE